MQDNDIYWLSEVGGNLHTITNNGKENELFNGVPDWVYEGKETHDLVKLQDKKDNGHSPVLFN